MCGVHEPEHSTEHHQPPCPASLGFMSMNTGPSLQGPVKVKSKGRNAHLASPISCHFSSSRAPVPSQRVHSHSVDRCPNPEQPLHPPLWLATKRTVTLPLLIPPHQTTYHRGILQTIKTTILAESLLSCSPRGRVQMLTEANHASTHASHYRFSVKVCWPPLGTSSSAVPEALK